MIDKYRLDDLRFESGEKGELARWFIQLQTDLDSERRKVGNSPVITDRWIPVSERMPEAGDDMIVFTDGIVMSGISYTKKKGFYIQALEYDDDEPVDSVTHWMPLPAAPQEVSNEK